MTESTPYNEHVISFSGVIPQLGPRADNNTMRTESGIGALMPWAGRLWFMSYLCGGPDPGAGTGLYCVDDNFKIEKHPESVAGTYANWLIHAPRLEEEPRPRAGYHFKGGHTSNGRVVVANSSYYEEEFEGKVSTGRLAEWDGMRWTVLEEKLIYLQDPNQYPLSLGLYAFRNRRNTEWHLMMAGATLTTLPLVIVFFVAQRYFLEGIKPTGIKG